LDSANTLRLKDHGQGKLVIGIRPENILLVDADDAVLSAQCLVAEPQGSHQVVAVEVGDKLMKIVAPSYPKVRSGETVHLAFKQEAIRFFDTETGLRI
jgi:multiple sugar transport system ATP-binding protein